MITDRTSQDVSRWRELHDKGWANMSQEERSEWLGEMKGRYSYTDMNRVENAVKALSAIFVAEGYIDTPLTTKTDWNRWSVPTRSDMTRYLGNIETLRSFVPLYPTTPKTPTVGQRLNYALANDIEQIILDLEDYMARLPNSRCYAGEIMAGEV